MSVHNGSTFLEESIDSMLNQSFTDFELIIINDSSTDRSKTIIQSYDDKRIVYLENEQNLGLAASLNKGIEVATGKYIARMDGDDISLPERLEKQVRFLEKNTNVGVVGTYAEIFGDHAGLRKHSEKNNELKVRTLFSCQFCHPTVMIRKEVLDTNGLNYNDQFSTAQDYELWSRMLEYTDFATFPEVLLKYRTHKKQVSVAKRQLQIEATVQIYRELLARLKMELTKDLETLHRQVAGFQFHQPKVDIGKIGAYFEALINANNKNQIFPRNSFAVFLSEYFYNMVNQSQTKLNRLKYYTPFFQSYFYPSFGKIKQLLK
jgi:glycosyltransferase involved in cell wall biosynthesis